MTKRVHNLFLLVGIIFLQNFSLTAQSTVTKIDIKAQVSSAEKVGTSAAMKDIGIIPSVDSDKKQQAKKEFKPPKNFIGRKRNNIVKPELEHQGPDPIRQRNVRSIGSVVEPSINVPGLTSGFSPNDPSGAIGKDHYVLGINQTTYAVYDREGNELQRFSGNSLWSPIGFTAFGDPIILYDQEFDRWILTEFAPPGQNTMLIAVSETPDPLGSYNLYAFGTPNFPDYPKFAIWDNSVTMTTNEQGGSQLETYFFDREQLMTGADDVTMQRLRLPGNSNTEAGFFVATPVNWTGTEAPNSDPAFLVLDDSSWGNAAQDQVNLYTVDVNFAFPDSTEVTRTAIITTQFDANPCSSNTGGFACIPQLGGGGLDGLPELITYQSNYRNYGTHESIVYNHITDVTDGENLAGIRWAELRRIGEGDWEMYQEGTFSPEDGLHRFMGSICQDGQGNIGLAYNVSSPETYAGIRFTGRRAGDPLGEMTVEEYNVIDGTNPINSGGRFGDYAHMTIDPVDDETFWHTTEYAGTTGGGSVDTRIIAFSLRRDTIDMATSALVGPFDSPDLDEEDLTISYQNDGINQVNSFQVGYIFNNGIEVIETVDSTILPGEFYEHTFQTQIQFDAFGPYPLKAFVNLSEDTKLINDTIDLTIIKLTQNDVAVTSISGLDDVLCGTTGEIDVEITNTGAFPLTSTTLDITIDNIDPGTFSQTEEWTGSLASGESTIIPILISEFAEGENIVEVIASNPNSVEDDFPNNNNQSYTVNTLIDGAAITLTLQLDQFPAETTWSLRRTNNTTLYSGGPYTVENEEIVRTFCLDPDKCYRFLILDSYGDGLTNNGGYTITDAEGRELAVSDGDFGALEIRDFCATFECQLTATADVTNSTGGSEGAILVTASEGRSPFQYSIDGGANFQSSNLFSELVAADYSVLVTDADSCSFTLEATVDVASSTQDFDSGVVVEVFPNPTKDVFRVNIEGLNESSVFTKIEIYNALGSKLQTRTIVKYDNTYTGQVSLATYPDGMYYVRLQNEKYNRLIKVIKGK